MVLVLEDNLRVNRAEQAVAVVERPMAEAGVVLESHSSGVVVTSIITEFQPVRLRVMVEIPAVREP